MIEPIQRTGDANSQDTSCGLRDVTSRCGGVLNVEHEHFTNCESKVPGCFWPTGHFKGWKHLKFLNFEVCWSQFACESVLSRKQILPTWDVNGTQGPFYCDHPKKLAFLGHDAIAVPTGSFFGDMSRFRKWHPQCLNGLYWNVQDQLRWQIKMLKAF